MFVVDPVLVLSSPAVIAKGRQVQDPSSRRGCKDWRETGTYKRRNSYKVARYRDERRLKLGVQYQCLTTWAACLS